MFSIKLVSTPHTCWQTCAWSFEFFMIIFNPVRGVLAAALDAPSLSFLWRSLTLCVCRPRPEAPRGSAGGPWKQWFSRSGSDAVYLRNWHGVGAPWLLRGTQRFAGLAERLCRQALARQNAAEARLPAAPWLSLDLHTHLNIGTFPAGNSKRQL